MVVTTIYWSNPTATLHAGDARDVLAAMPDGSADCIVTSPPYWAKRDYGVAGQYGHEPDPAGYIATLRAVFSEARRVLADDGTCWLNLGDSYSAGSAAPSGKHAYLGPGLVGPARPRHGSQEPARPALAGRARPPGRRMDHPQRHRLAQAQRHARVRPRPAQLPVRTDLPARQIPPLLVRPRPHPHAARHRPAAGALQPARAGGPARVRPRASTGQPPAPGGTHRPSTGRTPGRSSPPGGTAPAAACRATRTDATPATSGPSPPAPTGARTSPPTRSTCRPGASRPAASRAAWCSTRSAAPAPPAWPPSPSGRRFTGIELNPAFAALAAERLRHAAQPAARRQPKAATRMTGSGSSRPAAAAAADKPVTRKATNPCSHPPKTRPAAYARRPGAGPGRHHAGRTVTATAEDPSASCCRTSRPRSPRQRPGPCSGSCSKPTPEADAAARATGDQP